MTTENGSQIYTILGLMKKLMDLQMTANISVNRITEVGVIFVKEKKIKSL